MGRVVLVGGVLVLLFIPYLLWGTGLQTAQSQNLLRAQFKSEQHQAGVTTSSTIPPTKSAAAPKSLGLSWERLGAEAFAGLWWFRLCGRWLGEPAGGPPKRQGTLLMALKR